MTGFEDIKKCIDALVAQKKYRVATKHIEVDRAYREIYSTDAIEVLKNGRVIGIASDKRVEWEGFDGENRKIKLLCRLSDVNGVETLSVLDAALVDIKSAAHTAAGKKGKAQDQKLKEEWLKNNSDWVENSKGHVERKK